MTVTEQDLLKHMKQSGSIRAESVKGKISVTTTNDSTLNASLLAHLIDALLHQGMNREFVLAAVQAGLDAAA